MFFYSVLFAASLVGSAFAQLPANGTYNIVNRQTGFRWDVRGANQTPGTDVIGFPPQTPGLNQRWSIQNFAMLGQSGIYMFHTIDPWLQVASVDEVQGAGIVLGNYSRSFNITRRAADDAAYFIGLIDSTLAATSPESLTSPASPIVMEPLETSNNLAVWIFEPVP